MACAGRCDGGDGGGVVLSFILQEDLLLFGAQGGYTTHRLHAMRLQRTPHCCYHTALDSMAPLRTSVADHQDTRG
jgi:hypothetical protein